MLQHNYCGTKCVKLRCGGYTNVESNALFFILPKKITDKLRERYFFYDWDESRNEMRLVCSWDTTEQDIRDVIAYLKTLVVEA